MRAYSTCSQQFDTPAEKQVSSQNPPFKCEPLINARRAAQLLRVHPKTAKRMASTGILPGIKIGRVWRFRESALDEWMKLQLQCSRHPSPKGETF